MQKKTFVALLIAFIMVFSIFGFVMDFMFGQSFTYRGTRFKVTEQGLKTKIKGNEYLFAFSPEQLEWLSLPNETIQMLSSVEFLAITYDPESRLASGMSEAQFYLEQQLGKANVFVIRGLTNNSNHPDIPQITCANATPLQPVLEFRESDTLELGVQDNCVIASVQEERDCHIASERVLYAILGVMK